MNFSDTIVGMRLALLAALSCVAMAAASAKDVDFSQGADKPVDITTVARWAPEPQGVLRFDEVRVAPSALQWKGPGAGNWSADFGPSTNAYWLNFHVSNRGSAGVARVLVLANPLLDHLDTYVESADGALVQYKTGWAMDTETRPLPTPLFALPLPLGPGQEQSVWLRVHSPFSADASGLLMTQAQFEAAQIESAARNAWRMGVCCAALVISLLLWSVSRRAIYPLYTTVVLLAMLWLAQRSGELMGWVECKDCSFTPMLPSLTSLALCAAGVALLRHALGLAKLAPGADKFIKIWALGAIALACLLFWPAFSGALVPYFMGLSYLALLALTATQTLRQGWTAGLFLAAQVLPLVVAYGQTLADSASPDPMLMLAPPGHNGLVVGVILLGLAVGLQQAHKLRTQLQALRTLLTQQNQALERARQMEIDLEATVSQRTQSLALAAQRLESLSTVDGVTGVANRRRFDETLLVEWGRAARDKRPLSIALIDVDWFKSYNDCYGHPAGDECLRQLARVFEAGVMRNGDLIARYGGEEFVLIAPDTDHNGIQTIANYLCQEVFALGMPHEGSHYGRVSVSIGVATAYPHQGSKAAALVQEADAALYRAKAQGRHRVAGPA